LRNLSASAGKLLHYLRLALSTNMLQIAVTGFHPIDGACYLRDHLHGDPLLCRLVAHHSCAIIDARERGLDQDLASEFTAPPGELADALSYCDCTTSPDGTRVPLEQRIADICARYPSGDPVARALTNATPQLADSIQRVTTMLVKPLDPR
jgi:hypothetical protein